MRVVPLLFLALTICAACSDSPTAPTPTPTVRMWRLSGSVTDVSSAAPIANATVSVIDGPNAGRSTTTGADGSFALADLRESGFTVRVTRDAYDDLTAGITLTADMTRALAMVRTRLNLTGNWSGSFALTLDGQRVTASTTMQITQTDRRLSVTYMNNNQSNGVIEGDLSDVMPGATFTGAIRLETSSDQSSARCIGVGALIATPAANAIVFAASALTSNNCGGSIRDVVITVNRTVSATGPAFTSRPTSRPMGARAGILSN